MQRIFFGVKLNYVADSNNESERTEQITTNIDFIKVIMLIFCGDRSNFQKNQWLTLWELSVFDYINQNYFSEYLDVQVVVRIILFIIK